MFREICQVSYQTITNLSLDSQNLSVNFVNNQTNQFSLSEISAGSKNSPFMDMLNSFRQDFSLQKTERTVGSSFGVSAGAEKSNGILGSGNSDSFENYNSLDSSEVKGIRTENAETSFVRDDKSADEENCVAQKSNGSEKLEDRKKSDDAENGKTGSLSEKEDKISEDEKKIGKKSRKDEFSSLDFNKMNQIGEGGNLLSVQNGFENGENGEQTSIEGSDSLKNVKNNSKNNKLGLISEFESVNQKALDENNLQEEMILGAVSAKKASDVQKQENSARLRLNSSEFDGDEDSDFSDLLNNRVASDSLLESEMQQKNDVKSGKITVQDLRSENEKQNALLQAENGKNSQNNLKISDVQVSSDGTNFINMEMNQAASADVLSLNNQTAGANGSNFQSMLNNQIQSNISEFVKAGNIILKDNDQGQINLILHPDDLGNVKIHLSLDGKNISGQIIVSSKEALQVFKDNVETMREAFIKNGFDGANFDVAYNNSGSQSGNSSGFEQNDGTGLIAKKMYSNAHDSSGTAFDDDRMSQEIEKYSNYSVNIVA